MKRIALFLHFVEQCVKMLLHKKCSFPAADVDGSGSGDNCVPT